MATQVINCQFCGQDHGVQCPAVKAIEYFPNGKVKRVEFKSAADYVPMPYPLPYTQPIQPWQPLPVTWGPARMLTAYYPNALPQ